MKIITGIVLSVAVFFTSLVTDVAQAKVTVSENVKYFKISGKTGKQLYGQIRRKAPAKLRKRNWIAATYANYNFKKMIIGVRGNRCVIATSNIHLKLTYYYPKWTNRRGSSRRVKSNWGSFEKRIVTHERTHGKIYREMLQTIEREVRKMTGSARGGCKRYVKSVERKIASIEKRYNRKQIAFDRKENQSRSKISRIERAFIRSK